MRACLALSFFAACTTPPQSIPDAGTDAAMDASVDARGPITSWCDGGVQPGDDVVCDGMETSTTIVDGPSGPYNVIYTARTVRLHACSPMRVRMCNELVEEYPSDAGSVVRTECTEAVVLSDDARVQCGSKHTQYAPDGTTVVRDVSRSWTSIALEWL